MNVIDIEMPRFSTRNLNYVTSLTEYPQLLPSQLRPHQQPDKSGITITTFDISDVRCCFKMLMIIPINLIFFREPSRVVLHSPGPQGASYFINQSFGKLCFAQK